MSIVRNNFGVICERCGMTIAPSVSDDGVTRYIHHLRPVASTEPGAEQLRAFFAACPNVGGELKGDGK